MPTQSHLEGTTEDDGTIPYKFVVEFINGLLQQLRDLAQFFKRNSNKPYGL